MRKLIVKSSKLFMNQGLLSASSSVIEFVKGDQSEFIEGEAVDTLYRLSPFIPFSCRKIKELLQTKENKWKYSKVSPFQPIKQAEIIFERIDKQKIEEEVERMKEVDP